MCTPTSQRFPVTIPASTSAIGRSARAIRASMASSSAAYAPPASIAGRVARRSPRSAATSRFTAPPRRRMRVDSAPANVASRTRFPDLPTGMPLTTLPHARCDSSPTVSWSATACQGWPVDSVTRSVTSLACSCANSAQDRSSIARAGRAHTARLLLTATDLPLSEVAFAAGFASIRQFNDTMRAVYERTPGELRRGAPARPSAAADGAELGSATTPITLRLPARQPFDGRGLMRFFADHAITGIETGTESSFTRALRLPGGVATVHLELDGDAGVTCTAHLAELRDLAPLVSRMRRLFDLDADSVAIDTALSADPVLAPSVAAHPGIRLPGSVDAEETLFRTLFGQQVSVAAARTVLGRIAAELSGRARTVPDRGADRRTRRRRAARTGEAGGQHPRCRRSACRRHPRARRGHAGGRTDRAAHRDARHRPVDRRLRGDAGAGCPGCAARR